MTRIDDKTLCGRLLAARALSGVALLGDGKTTP